MASVVHWGAAALLAAGLGAAAWATLAVARWRREERHLAERLAGRTPRFPRTPVDLSALPAPVAAYLRSALPADPPLIRRARWRQSGEMRSDPRAPTWWRFTARQVVAPEAPGFLWCAGVRVAPGVRLDVRDALVDGHGRSRVGIWSLYELARETGGADLDGASLQRFLAEAAWYPTLLLPGPALSWSPIDATRARATLTHEALTASLEFRFSTDGDLASVFSPGRPRRVDDGYVLTPWSGSFADPRTVAGMRIPHQAEVAWQIDGEWLPVWRGRLTDVDYELVA